MDALTDLSDGAKLLPCPPLPRPLAPRPAPATPPGGVPGSTTLSAGRPRPTHGDSANTLFRLWQ